MAWYSYKVGNIFMTRFFELFCEQNDGSDRFRLGPALVIIILIMAFLGSSIYILFNSLEL
ncbi:MAG: hypothetical protein ACJ75F_12040 [Flavisolibacter sp.]